MLHLLLYYVATGITKSVTVFVGDPVIAGQDVPVIINCSQEIQRVIDSTGIQNPVINWYRDGIPIANGSLLNVVLSTDKSLCIITDTFYTLAAQLGTHGNYACQVCSDSSMVHCTINETITTICGEQN